MLVAEYDVPQRIRRLALQGDLLYLGDDRGSVQVVDISNPLAPLPRGVALTVGEPEGLAVTDEVLCIASGNAGFETFPTQCLDLSAVTIPTIPPRSELLAARPNPFNPATVIPFVLDRRQDVRITIHDLRGRTVAELLHGERPAGPGEVRWNGLDRHGRAMPSGVYFARLVTTRETACTRMVLIK